MKNTLLLLLGLGFAACSNYSPLHDPCLRAKIGKASTTDSGVKITYYGNSTLLIDDGKTSLLVDGFFSRPGPLETLFTKIGPDPELIKAELQKGEINHVNAVLVGHAHHDHALDATVVADHFRATVAGSRAFAQIHSKASNGRSRLEVIPPDGGPLFVGEDGDEKFEVRFVRSDHVGAHSIIQRIIKDDITAPLSMPAHYSQFGCGEVFALHISHKRHGTVLITTTAGAKDGQLSGREASIVFLGVGLLTKESQDEQNRYWRETVEDSKADVIVPVHWDNFTSKLDNGLTPFPFENPFKLMKLIKEKAGKRAVRVLDWGESIWIRNGKVYCPKPALGSARGRANNRALREGTGESVCD
ncbi:MAG TPA: MBL fold metallo-hydrolase [Chthoniobacterales bacterium]|nr:MBL fold metallo-hydrolase [Chthoniobacterales bacterium]